MKEAIIKASRNLFEQITTMILHQQVNLKEISQCPLGSIPQTLTGSNGEPKNTNEASLFHKLESDVESLNDAPSNCFNCQWYGYCQKDYPNGTTFQHSGEVSLQNILNLSKGDVRINFIFDVYLNNPIKGVEHIWRSSSNIKLLQVLSSNKITQWYKYFSSQKNKALLI